MIWKTLRIIRLGLRGQTATTTKKLDPTTLKQLKVLYSSSSSNSNSNQKINNFSFAKVDAQHSHAEATIAEITLPRSNPNPSRRPNTSRKGLSSTLIPATL